MTSTLTLYYKTILTRDKNYAFDDAGSGKGIELYLATISAKQTIVGFQYVKHSLSLSIRLDKPQSFLNMGSGAQDLNYVKIQNGEENPVYYFVTGKRWKSENTVEISLAMDTLNTFEYDVDYSVNKKTLVHREHMPRMEILEIPTAYPVYVKASAGTYFTYFYTDVLFQAGICDDEDDVDLGDSYATISGGRPASFMIEHYEVTERDGKKGVYITGQTESGATIHFVIKRSGAAARRVIHKTSEDIMAPKWKIRSETLYDSYQYSWDLLYRNRDIPSDENDRTNPVECYLIPETPLSIEVPTADGVIDANVLTNGQIILFFADYDPATIEFNGVLYTPESRRGSSYGYSSHSETPYAIKNNGGTFEFYSGSFYEYSDAGGNQAGEGGQWTKLGDSSQPLRISNLSTILVRRTTTLPAAHAIFEFKMYERENATDEISLVSSGTQIVASSVSIDRTDPRNIKLLRLPYAPCDVEVDGNGVVTLPPSWKFDSNSDLMKLEDPNVRFVHDVKPITTMSFLLPLFVTFEDAELVQYRNDRYESKLYHSDFFTPKFTYDSFYKNFELERIDASRVAEALLPNGYVEFTFVMSRNIVSKFLFDFDQYSEDFVQDGQDYNHVVCVARNNEEVLYSSQYLNYLRTGYNYDLKTKERTEMASGVGIGLNVAGLVASMGLSLVPGAQSIGAASLVASGIGLTSQLINYAKTVAQNDQNIAQKLQETQMQAVSVANADDCDLLDYYSGNKAMFSEYGVSEEMRLALADLFYYCGYRVERQRAPQKNGRYWFDFVQADLVIDDSNNLPSDVEDDVKERFRDGVTFFHYRGGFDLAQVKENWEMGIVPYLD